MVLISSVPDLCIRLLLLENLKILNYLSLIYAIVVRVWNNRLSHDTAHMILWIIKMHEMLNSVFQSHLDIHYNIHYIYSTANRSPYRHVVCCDPVYCKADGVGNQLGAWRYMTYKPYFTYIHLKQTNPL